MWHKFGVFTVCIDRIFSYLNKFYLTNRDEKSLSILCMEIFNKTFFLKLKERLVKEIYQQMQKDRNGDNVDRQLI